MLELFGARALLRLRLLAKALHLGCVLTLSNLVVLESLFGCFRVEERVKQTARLHGLLKLALELLLLLSLLKIDDLVHYVNYGLGLGCWAGLCGLIASGWASDFLLL